KRKRRPGVVRSHDRGDPVRLQQAADDIRLDMGLRPEDNDEVSHSAGTGASATTRIPGVRPVEDDGAPSKTTRPPTIVYTGLAPRMSSAGAVRMSCDRTTKSATFPSVILPFQLSANSAYADPSV